MIDSSGRHWNLELQTLSDASSAFLFPFGIRLDHGQMVRVVFAFTQYLSPRAGQLTINTIAMVEVI